MSAQAMDMSGFVPLGGHARGPIDLASAQHLTNANAAAASSLPHSISGLPHTLNAFQPGMLTPSGMPAPFVPSPDPHLGANFLQPGSMLAATMLPTHLQAQGSGLQPQQQQQQQHHQQSQGTIHSTMHSPQPRGPLQPHQAAMNVAVEPACMMSSAMRNSGMPSHLAPGQSSTASVSSQPSTSPLGRLPDCLGSFK